MRGWMTGYGLKIPICDPSEGKLTLYKYIIYISRCYTRRVSENSTDSCSGRRPEHDGVENSETRPRDARVSHGRELHALGQNNIIYIYIYIEARLANLDDRVEPATEPWPRPHTPVHDRPPHLPCPRRGRRARPCLTSAGSGGQLPVPTSCPPGDRREDVLFMQMTP